MSEISRSAPPAPKPTSAPANRGPGGNGPEERGDAFSALLSLVAETRPAPAPEASAGEPGPESADTETNAEESTPDGSDNPVARLLGWADPRSSDGRATATGTADRSQAMAAATTSADAAKSAKTGVDISGMDALATPEAIDPATLPPASNTAAGRAAVAAAALGDARDARTNSTRRDTKTSVVTDTTAALRATPANWHPLATASIRGTAAAGGSDALRSRGATWGNSTVSMDLSAAREADSVAGNAVSLTARLSDLLAGKTQADGAAPTPLLGTTQEASAAKTEGPSPTDLLANGEAALEPEPEQISHWSTQNLRHAHLRLGEGALDRVDIRLSMQGQDLSVDFRTDNADIRQSLAQQANQSLASLLERSGIALADVSVGAQQQRQPQGQGGEPQRGGASAQAGRGALDRAEADASQALRPVAAQPLRADGSRPLDLFV